MSSREAASIVDMWQPMVQALQVVIRFSNCVIIFQCFRVSLIKVCYYIIVFYIYFILDRLKHFSVQILCSEKNILNISVVDFLKYLCKN